LVERAGVNWRRAITWAHRDALGSIEAKRRRGHHPRALGRTGTARRARAPV